MISLDTPPAHEINPDPLLASLRQEIEEYGGLLALFEQQQSAILARNADQVLHFSEALEGQAETAKSRRKEREVIVAQLAPVGSNPTKPSTIAELLPHLREAIRPLVEALRDEINRLITQTRRRAQQNQMLLARTIETSQELMRRLNPEAALNTYSPLGKTKPRTTPRAGRLLSHS